MIFQIPSANTKVYQWAPSFEQSSHLGPIHRSCRWYVSRTKGIFVGSKWSLRNVGFVSGFYIIFIQLHRSHFLSPAFGEIIVGVLVSIPCNLNDVNQHEVLTCHFTANVWNFSSFMWKVSNLLWKVSRKATFCEMTEYHMSCINYTV